MASEDQKVSESWYQNLSVIRWIFAIFGILGMVFSGGCSLVVLANYFRYGRDSYGFNDPAVIAVVGGVPFAVALLMWWFAAKYKRGSTGNSNDD